MHTPVSFFLIIFLVNIQYYIEMSGFLMWKYVSFDDIARLESTVDESQLRMYVKISPRYVILEVWNDNAFFFQAAT